MAVHRGEDTEVVAELRDDFTARLQTSLAAADRQRTRRRVASRVRTALLVVMLIGPLIAWRLMTASPDGVHVVIDALAWIAFLLDVGVHLDSAVLASLNLQAIPTLVGVALAVLFGVQFLWYARKDE
jgi:hypothetical protein